MNIHKWSIDEKVTEVVASQGDRYFIVQEIVDTVCKKLGVESRVQEVKPKWAKDFIKQSVQESVKGRLTRFLQQKELVAINGRPVRLNGKPLKVRVYECYAVGVGKGPRRWQLLKAMTVSDLRVCLQSERIQLVGHQRKVNVYQNLIDLLDGLGPTAKVRDVFEEAVQQLS